MKSALAKAPAAEGSHGEMLQGTAKGPERSEVGSPSQLLLGFTAQMHENVINREYAIMLSPLPPSPQDIAFMKAGGYEYTPGASGQPSWKSNPTLGQRLNGIGGALLILLGDPMFPQNLHFEQPTELSRYQGDGMMI